MNFFAPLIFFILCNGFFVYILKKDFGKCLPLSIMINSIIYFFSQVIFKTFKVGFYINILFTIFFIIFILYDLKKNKNLDKFKKNFFSKGFYAFLIIYVCIFLYDLNRNFSVWDEFSHWGVMVKEMLRLDKFYFVDSSTLMVHKDYPPIIQLYELFYTNIIGKYSESSIIKSMHLLICILFIPSICDSNEKISKSKFLLKILSVIASIFMITLFFDQHNIINTIYVDYIMAVVVVYLLSIVTLENNPLEKFNIMRLSIGFIFLLLIKQIAISFYLMILFLFVITILYKYKNSLNIKRIKNSLKKIFFVIILILIIPLFTLKLWNNSVEELNVEKQFVVSDIKLNNLKGIINETSGEKYQQEAARNYIEAIKSENMTTSYIKLSYFQCIIVTILLILFLYIRCDDKNKKRLFLTMITLIIGSVGYAFLMFIMYIYSFGDIEGPTLASFNRYLPTYIIICILTIYYIYVYNSKSYKQLLITALILIIVQNPISFKKMVPKILSDSKTLFELNANYIKENAKDNSKIYIIAQNTIGDHQFYTKYYMDTMTTNLKYFSFPVTDIDNYQQWFNENVKDYMFGYDYLYLAQIDNEFINKYKFMFPNDEIIPNQLYKLDKKDYKLIKLK